MRAFGAEINPAAEKLAQVYTLINLHSSERTIIIEELNRILARLFALEIPLFNESHEGELEAAHAKEALKKLYCALPSSPSKDLLATLIVLLDFHNEHIPFERVMTKWTELREVSLKLPYSKKNH